MALVFTEEFETTLGATPSGWTVDFGSPVVTTGGYRSQCCTLDPTSQIHKALGGTYTTVTCFFVSQPNAAQGDVFTLAETFVVGTVTSRLNIFTVGYGNDTSIIVKDSAGHIVCNGVSHFSYEGIENIWTFIQVDVTVSATTIGTASAQKVVANLHLNGESIATGTSSFLTSLAPGLDTVVLAGVGNVNSKIDSVYVYDAIVASPIVTPNEAAGRKARISQAAIEHLDLPTVSAARVSQAAIEHLQLPSAAAARVSQAVIELILAGGRGWRVYES